MATDNLLLVHGRIGTLDIYAVAMMIWGVAFYLPDRPGAGRASRSAIGFCFKLVGPYALGILALLELARCYVRRRNPDSPAGLAPAAVIGRFAADGVHQRRACSSGCWRSWA